MLKRALIPAACLAIVFAPAPACADEAPRSAPSREAGVAQAYGRTHPECVEWSDSCIVCTKAGCSAPGIACTPVETVCRR